MGSEAGGGWGTLMGIIIMGASAPRDAPGLGVVCPKLLVQQATTQIDAQKSKHHLTGRKHTLRIRRNLQEGKGGQRRHWHEEQAGW